MEPSENRSLIRENRIDPREVPENSDKIRNTHYSTPCGDPPTVKCSLIWSYI